MYQFRRSTDRATVSDSHIKFNLLTNTQSSGFHVLEINGNGTQSIIYWIIGLFTLCAVAGGSGYGADTGKTQQHDSGRGRRRNVGGMSI